MWDVRMCVCLSYVVTKICHKNMNIGCENVPRVGKSKNEDLVMKECSKKSRLKTHSKIFFRSI